MSHTYSLVCIESGVVLDLGKMACLDEAGEQMPCHLTGWLDSQTRERIDGVNLWQAVQRFLIIHRNCNLRVMPEEAITSLDPEGKLKYIDSISELMSHPIVEEPDGELDAQRLPRKICEIVKSHLDSPTDRSTCVAPDSPHEPIQRGSR